MGLYDLINGTGYTGDYSSMQPQAPTPFSQSGLMNKLRNAYGFITNPGSTASTDMSDLIRQKQATFSPPAASAVTPPQVAPPVPAQQPPMAQAFAGGGVPLPQPRPAMTPVAPQAPVAGAPLNLLPQQQQGQQGQNDGPPSPFNFGPGGAQSGQNNQQNQGLIGRFVDALRGGGMPQGQGPQQPSQGLLPRLWNDVGSMSKAFGFGGAGSAPAFGSTIGASGLGAGAGLSGAAIF